MVLKGQRHLSTTLLERTAAHGHRVGWHNSTCLESRTHPPADALHIWKGFLMWNKTLPRHFCLTCRYRRRRQHTSNNELLLPHAWLLLRSRLINKSYLKLCEKDQNGKKLCITWGRGGSQLLSPKWLRHDKEPCLFLLSLMEAVCRCHFHFCDVTIRSIRLQYYKVSLKVDLEAKVFY